MWECSNCKQALEDKYRHCWNCGKPRTETSQAASSVRIHLKTVPPEKIIPPKEEISLKEELPPKEKITPKEELPFENLFPYEVKAPSVIGRIVPAFLWLAAFILAAGFTYYSYQKTQAFENRITEESRNLGSQTNQFVFLPNTQREKKGAIEKKGAVQAKVLPLNLQTKEVDSLYNFLPDDLRPSNLDEVKTILWLDCKQSEAGRYEDDSPAFQDKCNAFLVDRSTSKVIQVQDFLGELPPLKKQWGSSYASGKVLPETYISYIKANQPETERTPDRFAADSPNHHYWFKSELLYSSILLIFLGAIGIGWIVYRIKSAWKPE